MAKIFIGQAVTGQDIASLQSEMEKIYDVLKQKGHSVYSTLEEEGKNMFKKAGDWVIHGFKKIDEYDVYLAIVRTEHRSEGMLIEVGYTLAKKKKFILAINENVKNSYLADFADKTIVWKDFSDILNKLSKLKL